VVEVDNRTAERIDEAGLAAAVEHVLAECGAEGAEVGVLLVDEAEMTRLNREHRRQDGVTDVLSFPIDEDDDLPVGLPRMLGDVVVCPAQVARQADEASVPPGHELATMAVHGTLHLLGFDHERDAGEMLERQDALMAAVADVAWTRA
jgi:probable rRNA maturation factor